MDPGVLLFAVYLDSFSNHLTTQATDAMGSEVKAMAITHQDTDVSFQYQRWPIKDKSVYLPHQAKLTQYSTNGEGPLWGSVRVCQKNQVSTSGMVCRKRCTAMLPCRIDRLLCTLIKLVKRLTVKRLERLVIYRLQSRWGVVIRL